MSESETDTLPAAAVEIIRVRMTLAGEMDSANAARYLNRDPQTLAHWRVKGKGPEYEIRDGRIIYTKRKLDKYRKTAAKRASRKPRRKSSKIATAPAG